MRGMYTGLAGGRRPRSAKSRCDLKIEGITFVGIPGSVPRDDMNGIRLANATPGNIHRVRIVGNAFTGFRLHAVLIQNATDVTVEDNAVEGVSYGIRFSGVLRGKILGNMLRRLRQRRRRNHDALLRRRDAQHRQPRE